MNNIRSTSGDTQELTNPWDDILGGPTQLIKVPTKGSFHFRQYTPESIKDSTNIVGFRAWHSSFATTPNTVKLISERLGQRLIMLDEIGGAQLMKIFDDIPSQEDFLYYTGFYKDLADIPNEHLANVRAYKKMIDENIGDDDPIDIIAHSEGCIHALIFTALFPDKVRNIILNAPAGFTSMQSIPILATRLILDLMSKIGVQDYEGVYRDARKPRKGNMHPEYESLVSDFERLKYQLQTFKLIAKTEIREVYTYLQSLGKLITVIQAENDEWFPKSRTLIEPTLESSGGHNDFIQQSEHFSELVSRILTENKK